MPHRPCIPRVFSLNELTSTFSLCSSRFVAVTSPFKQRLTKTKTPFIILIIWAAAVSLASVQLVVARSTEWTYDERQLRECRCRARAHHSVYNTALKPRSDQAGGFQCHHMGTHSQKVEKTRSQTSSSHWSHTSCSCSSLRIEPRIAGRTIDMNSTGVCGIDTTVKCS